ncbi:MAG TPA: hypothetical protein VKL40_09575 [Candidatus Angelobacter sp.]|nr:hypothetical protein [Candidatus Angelobacter sp.]
MLKGSTMEDTYERHRKTSRKLFIAAAVLISLIAMPATVGQAAAGQTVSATQTTSAAQTTNAGQTTKSQTTPAAKTAQTKSPAAQAKSPADNLPDLPAHLATQLKPVGDGRVFVVAAPRSQAVARRPVGPPVRPPSGGSIAKLSCSHNTTYFVTASYPVVLCRPWIDDVRATSSGALAAQIAPAPESSPSPATTSKPTTSAASKQTTAAASASASAKARPASRLEPETKLSYRVRTSALGLMVCSYARMPVLATLQKRNLNCENPNAFTYALDIAGVGLVWTGDPEMRPADLRYFDEPSCRSDAPTSCSGASTCTPLCGGGSNPNPTPAPPPAVR